jgi:hypothetical protein
MISALPSGAGAASPLESAAECGEGVGFLGFSDALNGVRFEGTNVGGLSALARAPGGDGYLSLVDNEEAAEARFYTVGISLEGGRLGEPEVRAVTTLRDGSGEPFTGENFDGEGVAVLGGGDLLISSETEPSIRRFSSGGRLLGELPVPARFGVAPGGQAEENLTFESLTRSPSGHSLFTATEGPLAPDGLGEDGGNRIRILRYASGEDGYVPAEQYYYQTDAADEEPGQGVTELLALSDTELLALERGFVPDVGNTVRVYRVSLAGAEDVSDEESLAAGGVAPMEKTLLVDVADCPPSGATTPGTQANPLLDNYESLALGPRLEDGRRALLLQSDNNFNDGQVTRVLALAFEAEPDMPGTGGGGSATSGADLAPVAAALALLAAGGRLAKRRR